MSPLTRIPPLLARITTLEGHAAALQSAFRSEALKAEAQVVLATLSVAADDLRGEPSDAAVTEVEARLEVIAKRLSRLGQAT